MASIVTTHNWKY